MIEVKNYDGWNEFNNFIKKTDLTKKEYWFRGQSNPEWAISPTYLRAGLRHLKETNGTSVCPVTGKVLGRIKLPNSDDHMKKLQNGLEIFKQFSQKDTEKYNEYNSNDWWALARHHKLHTPMIDWTTDPLIAYYFAVLGIHGASNFNNIDDFYIGGSSKGNNGTIVVWQKEIANELEQENRFNYIR